jgi:hypothetical protein
VYVSADGDKRRRGNRARHVITSGDESDEFSASSEDTNEGGGNDGAGEPDWRRVLRAPLISRRGPVSAVNMHAFWNCCDAHMDMVSPLHPLAGNKTVEDVICI